MPKDTIPEMESKISKLTKQGKSAKIKSEIAKLNHEIKHQKELNKLTAAKLEIGNLSRLIIFDSDHGYAKMTDNSAIFYAANIAKRIGYRANLRKDTDHYAKSDFGIISIKYNEKLVEKLNAIGILLDEKQSTTHLHIFNLEKPFTEDNLKIFQDSLKKEEAEINKIIMPKNPIPTLFIYLKDLLDIIYRNSKNMPAFAQSAVGNNLVGIASNLCTEYLKFTEGKTSKLDFSIILSRDANTLQHQMKTVEILNLISKRNICLILEKLVLIKRLALKYYTEETAKEKEQNAK